jgi:hypothetical protein
MSMLHSLKKAGYTNGLIHNVIIIEMYPLAVTHLDVKSFGVLNATINIEHVFYIYRSVWRRWECKKIDT